jgi:large subunit ribosomal protein L21
MERYAIINVSGLQFKVVPDAVVRVPKLASEVGTPYLEGKEIRAEIIRHGRGKKIIVFKKKRRKDYQRKNGHRQQFTEIRIRNFPA